MLLYGKVEATGPAARGLAKALATKALQLTGGPNSPAPPPGWNGYGTLVATGQADVFLTYCTVAAAVIVEEPTLQVIEVPSSINVSTEYGLTVREGATPAAQASADSLVSGPGQGAVRKASFLPA